MFIVYLFDIAFRFDIGKPFSEVDFPIKYWLRGRANWVYLCAPLKYHIVYQTSETMKIIDGGYIATSMAGAIAAKLVIAYYAHLFSPCVRMEIL